MKILKQGSKTVLKMTRSEWEKVGKHAMWITAGYENPDGLVFETGKTFNLGPRGKGIITSISEEDRVANLKLEDGTELILDMNILKPVADIESHRMQLAEERSIEEKIRSRTRGENIREKNRERNQARMQALFATGSRGFYLMGVIAKYGIITAQVPSDQVDNYDAFYKEIKGVPPLSGSYSISPAEDKYAKELRIHLSKSVISPELLSLISSLGLDAKKTQSGYDINSNGYVTELLHVGFDIGQPNSQNIPDIVAKIEKAFGHEAVDQFNHGLQGT